MSKRVIYTSIFGAYDKPTEQSSDGWDWKCFSEENSTPLYEDNNRNAKKFKVLPHRYLQDYEYSIFIDGNMDVRGNLDELVDKYLSDKNVAFFSHNNNKLDARICPFKEAQTIIDLGNKNMKLTPERGILNYKDNPYLIQEQMNKYAMLGFPRNNGLITGMVILRRHNEKDCIETMEDWWKEIKYGSKRDQLSFNYCAWKNRLKFNYMDGDSRDNEYFYRSTTAHVGKK
jgi:hypothetical protein|tara:strand:+ start:6215 stop:6901 length:687 start_codon:yes stop_codon:yes gene_type:complete